MGQALGKMSFIVLLVVLLILIAVISVLIFAYSKLPRPLFFLLLSVLVVVPYLADDGDKRELMLSFVPDALGVSSVLYETSDEKGYLGLPGDETSGFRVYPISERIAKEIAEQGIEFFKNMPANKNQNSREWRGNYMTWLETPVLPDHSWKSYKGRQELNIIDYLCGGEGLCMKANRKLIDEANEIINSSGSYYAYGRIGFIVASPSTQQVFYFYNR